ncbi:MAG: hypothetical protein ACRELB_14305 [Polyangiaceae bacterium]
MSQRLWYAASELTLMAPVAHPQPPQLASSGTGAQSESVKHSCGYSEAFSVQAEGSGELEQAMTSSSRAAPAVAKGLKVMLQYGLAMGDPSAAATAAAAESAPVQLW